MLMVGEGREGGERRGLVPARSERLDIELKGRAAMNGCRSELPKT